jgi:hypothetical protein
VAHGESVCNVGSIVRASSLFEQTYRSLINSVSRRQQELNSLRVAPHTGRLGRKPSAAATASPSSDLPPPCRRRRPRAVKAREALGGGRFPSRVARAEVTLDLRRGHRPAAGLVGGLRGGIQGGIRGGGLGRRFLRRVAPAALARAAVAG